VGQAQLKAQLPFKDEFVFVDGRDLQFALFQLFGGAN